MLLVMVAVLNRAVAMPPPKFAELPDRVLLVTFAVPKIRL